MVLKQWMKNALGPRMLGRYDLFFRPGLKSQWGGAFNGQQHRRRIFKQLCDRIGFDTIIETGAYRGNTSLFMAGQGVAVRTVELDERAFGYVSTRFAFNPAIRVEQGDSRAFLQALTQQDELKNQRLFFYLDAHWGHDLPLAEELQIIFDQWQNAIVMIDDFQVHGTDYSYDDYGPGRALDLDYLAEINHSDRYSIWFPSVDASLETGARRGCVVLSIDADITASLLGCDTLRRYADWPPGGAEH